MTDARTVLVPDGLEGERVDAAIALGLLLGGALGNLVDRFFRPPGPGRGHVVDFIDYFGWFVGNVADIAIVVAAGIIMVLAFTGTSIAGPVHHVEHADG